MSIKVGDMIKVLRDLGVNGPRAGDIEMVSHLGPNGTNFYLASGWGFHVRDLGITFELYQPPGQLTVPSPFAHAYQTGAGVAAISGATTLLHRAVAGQPGPPVTLPTLEEAHVCDMKRYEGLTERYDFCASCDRKQEIT